MTVLRNSLIRICLVTLHLTAAAGPLESNRALSAGPPARPWGPSFVPKSKPPASDLRVIPLDRVPTGERMAVTCLQGLVARGKPAIWIQRGAEDLPCLEYHKKKHYISGYEIEPDWRKVFRDYHALCKGVVVPDGKLFRGELLALNVAACEDALVGSPALANDLHLPVIADLRGRFPTYADGLRWVWSTYQAKLNPYLCDIRCPGLVPYATFDYSYQWRGLMFWLAGPKEAGFPGVNPAEERKVIESVFSEMPPLGICVGFPAMSDGEGIGEPQGVELLSRFGKSLVCTNHISNYSFLSGIREEKLTPPPPLPPPPLEQDKVYIALVLSDGDNEILWPGFFRKYFEHKDYGKFPLAFGMGPAIRELQPGNARWCYESAAPNTEFICDVSGAGYIHSDKFGEALANREEVWSGFLAWTGFLMERMGQRSIRTVGGNDAVLARYAAALPFCHSIFADMGRYSGREGISKLTYSLPDGMPVFRSVTSWRNGKEGFLKEIREQVGSRRPAFVNGFVHCWTFDMETLAKIHTQRDKDMVFVTPSQLAALYRRSLEPPAARD